MAFISWLTKYTDEVNEKDALLIMVTPILSINQLLISFN